MAVAVVSIVAACTPPASPIRIQGNAQGTTYEVLVARAPRSVRRAQVQSIAEDVLADVDLHLSGWNARSELARFNAIQTTDWVPVSALLLEAIEAAAAMSLASDGAFDVTVAPVVEAWGFGAGADAQRPPPTEAEVEVLCAGVGHQKLELRREPSALRKTVVALRVDLDGIAPGLTVDRIAARLEERGIRDYLVELGGEVRARGRSPAGRPWRVAVEAPLAGERRPLALVELDDTAVSTSGDYRDFRYVNESRVGHTIDPRSCSPVSHSLASVTVVHSSAAVADAWATALMVLGPVEGLAVASKLGIAALFVERGRNGALEETMSPAFAPLRRPLDRAL
jgi:thiamine biosynthesis lipoprotein